MKKLFSFTLALLLISTFLIGSQNLVRAEGHVKEIDVWVYESFYPKGEDSAIQEATDEFNEEHPDIKANLIPTVYGSGSFRDKFIRVARGGGGPDVIMNDIIWVPQLAAMDLLKPIGGMLGEDKAEFFQTPVEAATYEDKLYGIPFHTNALAYYYNKDLMEEAGLDPENPPQTWAEFNEAAQLIGEKTDAPGGYGYLGHWGGSFEWFVPFWAHGGSIMNEDYTKATLNNEKGLEATRFWFDMVQDPNAVPKASTTWKSWEEIASGFATETVGLVYGFPNVLQSLNDKDIDFDWDVAKMPKGPEGRYSMLGGGHLSMSKNCENPEAAYKWMEYMTAREQLSVFDANNRISARKDAGDHQEFLDNPKMQTLFESLEFAKPRPPIPEWTQIDYDTIQPQFQKVLNKGKSVEDALDDAAKGINKILED